MSSNGACSMFPSSSSRCHTKSHHHCSRYPSAIILAILITLLFNSLVKCDEQNNCFEDEGWLAYSFNGTRKCIKIIDDQQFSSFAAARAHCQSYDSQLIKIGSMPLRNFIASQLRVGGGNFNDDEQTSLATGQPYGYWTGMRYSESQPHPLIKHYDDREWPWFFRNKGKMCIVLLNEQLNPIVPKFGHWYTSSCSPKPHPAENPRFGAICEKPLTGNVESMLRPCPGNPEYYLFDHYCYKYFGSKQLNWHGALRTCQALPNGGQLITIGLDLRREAFIKFLMAHFAPEKSWENLQDYKDPNRCNWIDSVKTGSANCSFDQLNFICQIFYDDPNQVDEPLFVPRRKGVEEMRMHNQVSEMEGEGSNGDDGLKELQSERQSNENVYYREVYRSRIGLILSMIVLLIISCALNIVLVAYIVKLRRKRQDKNNSASSLRQRLRPGSGAPDRQTLRSSNSELYE